MPIPQPPDESTTPCQICGRRLPAGDLMPGHFVRSSIEATIRKAHPGWDPDGYICLHDLNVFRARHVEDVLAEERGELSALEAEVIRGMHEQEAIAQDVNSAFDRRLTLGERMADRIAEFGGSWGFILSFGGVLLVWILFNSISMLERHFDPYPFILLNLVLSCLAALQAPIIMMSQNRQEAKDRLRSENDFRINLKAELEIRNINAKLDLLLTHQWQRLLEIQRIQMEMMEGLIRNPPNPRSHPEASLAHRPSEEEDREAGGQGRAPAGGPS